MERLCGAVKISVTLLTVKINLLRNGLYATKNVNIGVFVPRNEDYGCDEPNQTLANKTGMTSYCGDLLIIKKKNAKLENKISLFCPC